MDRKTDDSMSYLRMKWDPARRDEPGRVGNFVRDVACRLISREQQRLEDRPPSLDGYAAAQKEQRQLAREFNRINQVDFGATLAAARTVCRLSFKALAFC